jgi:hypothetical protein
LKGRRFADSAARNFILGLAHLYKKTVQNPSHPNFILGLGYLYKKLSKIRRIRKMMSFDMHVSSSVDKFRKREVLLGLLGDQGMS